MAASGMRKLLVALLLLGIPGLFGVFLLTRLETSTREEARRRERDDIREVLAQVAARGNLSRRFGQLFDRLTQQSWTAARFAPRAAAVLKQNPGVVDLYLYTPDGQRVPLPGIPQKMLVASQQFLAAVRFPDRPVSEKMVQAFAGSLSAARLLAATPGTLVELMNGDRLTWGGWWQLRDRRGRVTGHLVAFVHRQGIDPDRLLDLAVEESNRLVQGRFICGWQDPLAPDRLRPAARRFPPALRSALDGLQVGQYATTLDHQSLVTYPAENGALLFGLSVAPQQDPEVFTTWRIRLALALALLAGLVAMNLAGRRSLRSQLVGQLAIAGGFPLAVFLSAVEIDRQDREVLVEKALTDSQLEYLSRFDGNLHSRFLALMRLYRQLYAATRRDPRRLVPRAAAAFRRALAAHRDLVTQCIVVDDRGEILFFQNFTPHRDRRREEEARDTYAGAVSRIVDNVNDAQPASGTAKTAGAGNPIVGMMIHNKGPFDWIDEDDQIRPNVLGKEKLLSYLKMYPGPDGKLQALLVATHDSRKVQVGYLESLIGARRRYRRGAPRLMAVPVIPGGSWPSFPEDRLARLPEIRKLRDLVLTSGLPQHQTIWLGTGNHLVSAVRGHFLDGYVLMVAQPVAALHSRTRRLGRRAGILAGFMLAVACLTAWGTARLLLRPLAGLAEGVAALEARDFQHQVVPGDLAELAQVANRFNQVLENLRDLEMARAVQETLWPARGLETPECRIAGRCMTAAAVGGDFFDWFVLPDRRVVVAVGDVAGHGIPSALVAASAKVELAMNAEAGAEPAAILTAINAGLLKQAGRKRPMTFWVGIFEPAAGRLRYASAGHNFPFVVRASGEAEQLACPGYPLGARLKGVFTGRTIDLAPGDRLYAYSDGLVEAHAASGEPFDYDRLGALFQTVRPAPPAEAIGRVFAEVQAWSGRTVPEDDQTLVVLHVESRA